MLKFAVIAISLAIQGLAGANAAQPLPLHFGQNAETPIARFVQDGTHFPVQPSQAAMAAQAAFPGSTVLGVKLLPSGEYAVTLKIGGNVQRVMVNATNGQVS